MSALADTRGEIVQNWQVPRVGLESPPDSSEKASLHNQSGADSGALADTAVNSAGPADGLDALAAALLGLSPADRAKLAAMLLQGSPGEPGKEK